MLLGILIKTLLPFVLIWGFVWWVSRKARRVSGSLTETIGNVAMANVAVTAPVVCGHCDLKVERAKACSNCGAPLT